MLGLKYSKHQLQGTGENRVWKGARRPQSQNQSSLNCSTATRVLTRESL